MLLFGTDGIRGRANAYPMTPEMAVRTGKAVVSYFRQRRGVERPAIVIGRDTRLSGAMLEAAVTAGVCAMGGDVFQAGVIPTPGIAFLTVDRKAAAGIVISASHNPYQDNGIKLFKGDGYKLSAAEEAALEGLILDDDFQRSAESIVDTGRVHPLKQAHGDYTRFLQRTFQYPADCKLFKLVVDCSNGATSTIAPALFESLGFAVTALFNAPDGKNINAGCGSQHPQKMAAVVLQEGADLGLAFDGDGDRLIAVDEKGRVLSGDQVIAVCARHLKAGKRLRNDLVVTTVMSNIGLGLALKSMNVRHTMCDVGDRHVVETMLAGKAVLGGEDSGHIVFHDRHTTGDGMLAALQLLEVILAAGKPLSTLADVMRVFPQVLINVDVSSKPLIDNISEIKKVIDVTEKELQDRGRVLVRYSGTQDMCRVMVEAATDDEARRAAERIASVVREAIG